MPRRCSVCDHPRKGDIDQALVQGEPYRIVASRNQLSASATFRHQKYHLPASLVRAREAKEAAQADQILAVVCKLQRRAERIFRKTEKSGDHRTSLAAIRELRGITELLAKLAGELREGTTVNVLVSPEYQLLQQTIITTLAPYPAARVAVAKALKELPNARP